MDQWKSEYIHTHKLFFLLRSPLENELRSNKLKFRFSFYMDFICKKQDEFGFWVLYGISYTESRYMSLGFHFWNELFVFWKHFVFHLPKIGIVFRVLCRSWYVKSGVGSNCLRLLFEHCIEFNTQKHTYIYLSFDFSIEFCMCKADCLLSASNSW